MASKRPRVRLPPGPPRDGLIRRRVELGIKRPQLAQMLGIKRFSVNHVESDSNRGISAELMARWTRALKTDLSVWPEADRQRYMRQLAGLASLTDAVIRQPAPDDEASASQTAA